MKTKDLVWESHTDSHGGFNRRGRKSGAIYGYRSQYLYGFGRCVGYAVKTEDEDGYAFFQFGELGEDKLVEVSKLELAALIADLVGSVP